MSIVENLEQIHCKIETAATAVGRDANDIQLLAVSKRQPREKILEALQAGHRHFAENRVQEAREHWEDIRDDYPDLKIHLIGPLQTNKAKEAVALFDMIETVDREKLARKLGQEMKAQGRDLPCLIQVNTGGEPQKAGIAPTDLPGFLEFCRVECALDVAGLMCIPPIDDSPALHFAFLKNLAARHSLPQLSMGMSGDFEKAVMAGATMVRVGTAIFGPREF